MRNGDILPFEFMARREDWSEGISVYMRQRTAGHGESVAAPVMMVRRNPGEIVKPMFRLEIHAAQQLMDELWQCGLRPSEGTGSAGAMAATERHLADMQKIAFMALDQVMSNKYVRGAASAASQRNEVERT